MEGSGKLFMVLPEEIWRVILSSVNDSQDLESLSNSSPLLRRMLHTQSTLFLFQKVFQIVVNHRPWDCQVIAAKCRLVCSSWNKTVEEYYESHLSPEKTAVVFPQQNRSGIGEFLEHFQNTHSASLRKNPILGRSVVFDDTLFHAGMNCFGPDYLSNFYTDISRFLSCYGHEVNFCKIRLQTKYSSVEDLYLTLCEWLDLMRNVSTLNLIFRWEKCQKDKFRTLEREILKFPLPRLRHLKTLHTTGLPTPILNELIRKTNPMQARIM